jgi:hypothetical protein
MMLPKYSELELLKFEVARPQGQRSWTPCVGCLAGVLSFQPVGTGVRE